MVHPTSNAIKFAVYSRVPQSKKNEGKRERGRGRAQQKDGEGWRHRLLRSEDGRNKDTWQKTGGQPGEVEEERVSEVPESLGMQSNVHLRKTSAHFLHPRRVLLNKVSGQVLKQEGN